VTNEVSVSRLDGFFRAFLDIEQFGGVDKSLNGLQVDNNGAPIGKIAFAVDACGETIRRAVRAGAGMLFVHHGLFWGEPRRLAGNLRERVKLLLDHNLTLYAVHLPLDQNPELGNNAALAELLGIQEKEAFGLYRGRKIGWKGKLAHPLSVDQAAEKINFMGRPPLGLYPFGKDKNETCAVISGGAADEALQALEEGIDLYVTGETSHQIYHEALEGRLNIIAGGHYNTEVWGVRKVMEKCALELSLDTEFIDVPTGL
jgi:dinuclear metal center YbgI/SA1388 family protein